MLAAVWVSLQICGRSGLCCGLTMCVLLRQVIDPPGSQYLMLVMEFLEKGPVLQTRDQAGFDCLPEEVAADYFRQAVAGLEYLHYHKVVHGDLKPENLLVSSNGELKISDFGCSRCGRCWGGISVMV